MTVRVAVLSGKGGVGKTTISAAAARALASVGRRVGLADFDVTGSDLHRLLEVRRDFDVRGDRIVPAEASVDGLPVRFVSLALVSESFVRWPGARHADFVRQVLEATDFSGEDYVVCDAAPGLHEDAMEVARLADACLLVTIGGRLAPLDLGRTLEFLRDEGIPVAGAYLNMSRYVCPGCGREERLFGDPPELGVPVIEEVPWTPGGLPRLDPGRLLERLGSPVVLPPARGPSLRRRLVEALLVRLGGG
jgi:ATP-binding protein involved in chromosome partitioning